MARSSKTPDAPISGRVSTGVAGLDNILGGGLPPNHLYLVEGIPGTGKTTLALQFLLEGAAQGQRGIYVTLSESRRELSEVAASHGWSLGNIDVEQAVARGARFALRNALACARSPPISPPDSRPQAILWREQATVLLLDDKSGAEGDLQLHSLAHGVILLEHVALEFGAERRRLQVTKLRGLRFWGGYHDFRIRTGGLVVYPRITSGEPDRESELRQLESGSGPLDQLLGGGFLAGSSVLIMGPAGTGKSVLATQYACAATARGDRVRFYLFDERMHSFLLRNRMLGMDVDSSVANSRLQLEQIEPTQMSPGEFANDVVRAVEHDGVRLIIIDSINGYMKSMPEERLLPIQIHELLSYLANRGCTSIMTLVQHGVFGNPVDEAAEVSYLADTVLLLRYFEVLGSVRQAISVVKKRSGNHERTIRECRVTKGGMTVGEPLVEFQGVLTGVPEYRGAVEPLMPNASDRLPRTSNADTRA